MSQARVKRIYEYIHLMDAEVKSPADERIQDVLLLIAEELADIAEELTHFTSKNFHPGAQR